MDSIMVFFIPKGLRSSIELTGLSPFEFCDVNKTDSELSKYISGYDARLIREIDRRIIGKLYNGIAGLPIGFQKEIDRYIRQNATKDNVLLNSSEVDLSQLLNITSRGYDTVIVIDDALVYNLLTTNGTSLVQPFYDYVLKQLFETYGEKMYTTMMYKQSIQNYIRLVKSGHETI